MPAETKKGLLVTGVAIGLLGLMLGCATHEALPIKSVRSLNSDDHNRPVIVMGCLVEGESFSGPKLNDVCGDDMAGLLFLSSPFDSDKIDWDKLTSEYAGLKCAFIGRVWVNDDPLYFVLRNTRLIMCVQRTEDDSAIPEAIGSH